MRSAKDKAWDEMKEKVAKIANALKINDWTIVENEYDDLNKRVEAKRYVYSPSNSSSSSSSSTSSISLPPIHPPTHHFPYTVPSSAPAPFLAFTSSSVSRSRRSWPRSARR